MTHNEFNYIISSINALSPDQMRQLYRELEKSMAAANRPAPSDAGRDDAFDVASRAPTGLTDEELADQELQRRLFDAGLLSEIKPPLRDLTPYRDRQAVPITGEPLSETVIRERR